MRRTGLLGGTFDPIHTGHLILAESILSDAGLDRILFVPAKEAPHKIGVKSSEGDHRTAMLRLALKDQPAFEVSDCEMRRNGPSYTIDTILNLKTMDAYGSDEFFLILGMDNLLDFHTWKNPGQLLDLATVICMPRPGFEVEKVHPDLMKRVKLIDTPLIDISATMIRRRVKEGLSIKFWTPLAVADYISSQGLYL